MRRYVSKSQGTGLGVVRAFARLAAGVAERRHAARRAWAASDPSERAWDAMVATSTAAGWLGPTGGGPLPPEVEARPRTPEAAAPVPAAAVTDKSGSRPTPSWRGVLRFVSPAGRRLATGPNR